MYKYIYIYIYIYMHRNTRMRRRQPSILLLHYTEYGRIDINCIDINKYIQKYINGTIWAR